jgi:hypothetical protein
MTRPQFLHHRAVRADACVSHRRQRCPDRMRFALATIHARCLDRRLAAAHKAVA